MSRVRRFGVDQKVALSDQEQCPNRSDKGDYSSDDEESVEATDKSAFGDLPECLDVVWRQAGDRGYGSIGLTSCDRSGQLVRVGPRRSSGETFAHLHANLMLEDRPESCHAAGDSDLAES